MYLISVDTIVIGNLLVLAVAASEEEDLLLPVLLGIQYVVAFAAEFHGTHPEGIRGEPIASILPLRRRRMLDVPEQERPKAGRKEGRKEGGEDDR